VVPTIETPPIKEPEDSEGEGDGALEVDEDNEEGGSDDKDVLEEDLNSLSVEGLTTQDPAKLKSMEISFAFPPKCMFYFLSSFIDIYASLKAAKERLKAELEELKAEMENDESLPAETWRRGKERKLPIKLGQQKSWFFLSADVT